jgi:hypothetical protein
MSNRLLLLLAAGLIAVLPITRASAFPAPDGSKGGAQLNLLEGHARPTCGKYGTSVTFLNSPSEAARQAKQEEKLVFVLHVSGHFEDPKFT